MTGMWAAMQNQPPSSFSSESMILLTDGSVLFHNAYGKDWLRLSPDLQGNYSTGSWSSAINMANTRQFFASGVLKDGKVFAIGGEYSDAGNDTPLGETFDPTTNKWSQLNKPDSFSWIQGDASCSVLPDGRVLLGSLINRTTVPADQTTAIYDPSNINNLWTEAGKKFGTSTQTKVSGPSEETWTLLPDGTVLTVEVWNPNATEKYLPASDEWVNAGNTPQSLPLTSVSGTVVKEIGPAVVLSNGNVFAIGATGHTAIYTPQTGGWSPGPDFPMDSNGSILTAIDAPACLLPNGKVLCVAGSTVKEINPTTGQISYWSNPTTFFEYDPATNHLSPPLTSQPATNPSDTWKGRLLLLPNEQVLFTSQQNQIYIYTPDGSPQAAWKPVITNCPQVLVLGRDFTLKGQRLNGLSQAISYGDDYTAATNYPIVQLKQGSQVVYCRTHEFSTLGITSSAAIVQTQVTVPRNVSLGSAELYVIANGIPSDPFPVVISPIPHLQSIVGKLITILFGVIQDGGGRTTGGPEPPWEGFVGIEGILIGIVAASLAETLSGPLGEARREEVKLALLQHIQEMVNEMSKK
jgi:hypothetical protein